MRNRFKGLDLIDRVPEELWTKVHDIVQEAVIKTISKKKKFKKTKWLSEEALWIAEKIREAKGRGEKERYNHLNTEFQRIARRDKKIFLSDHCKEIEENNRMGKTRDLFRKIRDIKGRWAWKRTEMVWTLHRQKILRTGAQNTQKNCTKKKIFMTQRITMVWSLT